MKIIARLKNWFLLLRIMPDFSLRLTYLVVSFCLILSAYLLGSIHGQRIAAESQLAVANVRPHEQWGTALLGSQNATQHSSTLIATSKNFVASQNGKIFYPASCKSASRIKEENRIWFATAIEAKASGLSPAKGCTVE